MSAPEKTAVVACMRNEGLFIVEWIAYHRVIGFDDVVICSNDCTDGSEQLLNKLHRAGVITHLPHNVGPGDTPQDSGMRAAFHHLERSDSEWLAHIDSDEFINIGIGDGSVAALLSRAGGGDVIALPWWSFGDSGHIAWPGSVLSNFTQAEDYPQSERCKFKSMFRFRLFEHARDHRPVGPKRDDLKVRSADGKPLQATLLNDPSQVKYRPFERSIVPEYACINHYAVPSRNVFLMKNDRGDGQARPSDKYHLGSRWHKIANQNAAPNTTIQRHLAATQEEMTRLRNLPEIAEAERLCVDWHTSRHAALLSDQQIARWSKPHARTS